MLNTLVCTLLSAALTLPVGTGPDAVKQVPLSANKWANVSAIHLRAGSQTTVQGSTTHGLVWVAITQGAVEVSGASSPVAEAAMGCVAGKAVVTLKAPAYKAAVFVIVDVLDAFQNLTLNKYASEAMDYTSASLGSCLYDRSDPLSPGQILQQHSDQNDALIVAVSPVKLRHVWDLEESDSWRPSKPETIRLKAGGVRWTKPGIHQFKNVGDTPASFIVIEW